jgi:hypothetical protein
MEGRRYITWGVAADPVVPLAKAIHYSLQIAAQDDERDRVAALEFERRERQAAGDRSDLRLLEELARR